MSNCDCSHEEVCDECAGWIKWYGGTCPVPADTIVNVRHREGHTNAGRAGKWTWIHAPLAHPGDIVAYRVIEDGKKPAPIERAMSALAHQEGGSHYKDLAIQPVEYIHKNGIGFCEGSAIKYLTRWREKGGVEDLKKAKHFIDLLIELEGDEVNG